MLIYESFERMREGGRPAWFARIMAHEMTHPTPAFDLVTEAMGANSMWFLTLVGKLIGRSADDPRTRMCVHSVAGQVVHYMRSRPMLSRLWPDLKLEDEEQRRAIAEHVVAFSLAGVESVARQKANTTRRDAHD